MLKTLFFELWTVWHSLDYCKHWHNQEKLMSQGTCGLNIWMHRRALTRCSPYLLISIDLYTLHSTLVKISFSWNLLSAISLHGMHLQSLFFAEETWACISLTAKGNLSWTQAVPHVLDLLCELKTQREENSQSQHKTKTNIPTASIKCVCVWKGTVANMSGAREWYGAASSRFAISILSQCHFQVINYYWTTMLKCTGLALFLGFHLDAKLFKHHPSLGNTIKKETEA